MLGNPPNIHPPKKWCIMISVEQMKTHVLNLSLKFRDDVGTLPNNTWGFEGPNHT